MIEASVDVEAVFAVAMSLQQRPGASGAAAALGLVGDGAGIDVDDLARRMERAIAGDTGTLTACRQLLAKRHPNGYRCDAVSLGVLHALGVAPETVAAIGMLTAELEVDPVHFEVGPCGGPLIGIRVEGLESGMRVEADLAPDMAVVWNEPLIVLRDGLPETIMLAATGRPLSDIITHPALTGLGLVIAAVTTDKRGGTVLSIGGSVSADVTSAPLARAA